MELTNCRNELATKYLIENNWNIKYALNVYYNEEFDSFVGESNNRERIPLKDLSNLFNRYSDQVNPDGTRCITFEGKIKNIEEFEISKENESVVIHGTVEGYLNENTSDYDDDLYIVIFAELLSWKKKMKNPINYNQFCDSWFVQGSSNLKDMKLLLDE